MVLGAALIGPHNPLIDQTFLPGVEQGMVRCYLSGDRVVGFGEQQPRVTRAPDGSIRPSFAIASPKAMCPADRPDSAAISDLRAT